MISAAIRQRLQHTIVNCFTLLFSLCIFAFSPLHSLIAYADGWSLDESTGIWTYVQLHTDGPGYFLKKGWHADIDGYQYYLHDETGYMLTGYHVIGDKLCYFKDEPNQDNYRQHEDSFWYYYPNDNIPYGALIAMCDWPGLGNQTTSVEAPNSSAMQSVSNKVNTNSNDSNKSDDHDDTSDSPNELNPQDGTNDNLDEPNTHDDSDTSDNDVTDSENPNEGNENNSDDGSEDNPDDDSKGSPDDGSEANPDDNSEDNPGDEESASSTTKSHSTGSPCVSHDSLETIRENLEGDPNAYDECIHRFCRKSFQLKSFGFQYLEGDPLKTKLADIYRNFDEDKTIDIEAVLYQADETDLRFMTIDTPDALKLPMHTGVHYSESGENSFDRHPEDYWLTNQTEPFTNLAGVPNTLLFGLLNGYEYQYGYKDDSSSSGEALTFFLTGCELYEVIYQSDDDAEQSNNNTEESINFDKEDSEASNVSETYYEAVDLVEEEIDYDAGYLSDVDDFESAYTRFFIPSKEELEDEAVLRQAILEGEKCWLRNLPDTPEDEEELETWKTKFLYQSKGNIHEVEMSEKLPVRFYFIVN